MNLPFQQLAYQILKKKLIKKVKRFIFNYHFRKTNFSNIAVDLLPHAISFILTLNNESEINIKVFKIFRQNLLENVKQ